MNQSKNRARTRPWAATIASLRILLWMSWPLSRVGVLALALGTLLYGPACSGISAGVGGEPPTVTASPKELLAFGFTAAANPSLTADVAATVSGDSVTAIVPFGTDVRGLRATFRYTGVRIVVGGVEQESGVTPNDFTSPVTYVITAADGSERSYGVTIAVASSSAHELEAFGFLKAQNPQLAGDIAGIIAGGTVSLAVPYGTDVKALKASFQSTGAGVTVNGVVQTSGVTANDFTSPVTYVVSAADGSRRSYTVTVTIASAMSKDITSFVFYSAINGTLPADVKATVTGNQITATLPFGTSVTALVASFEATASDVSVNGEPQESGVTPNDFTNPVTYVVKAADGSTRSYTVTVSVAPSSAKELTSFAFLTSKNPGLLVNVNATIVGTSITALVPFGTNVDGMKATFQTTGKTVTVGNVPQVSGVSALNFMTPVTYVVKASDGSSRSYTVTVTRASNLANDVTSFSFLSSLNPQLQADATGTISGTTIAVTLPYRSLRAGLRASFQTTGSSVTVMGVVQTSGVTENDFTNPVTYVVSSADGAVKSYSVTVTLAQSSAKDVTSFAFLSANNATLSADVTATIHGTSITATVPHETNLSTLRASFQTTGVSVAIGGATQTSGVTPIDFGGGPVTYVVTAADGTTKSYTVTVTAASAPAKEITQLYFLSSLNMSMSADVTATIVGTSITATVPYGTNLTTLKASFIATASSVRVGSVAQVSGVTANDFTSPVTYVVTAADSSTKSYTVTVTVAPSSAKALTSFSFLAANNAALSTDVTASIGGTSITATIPVGGSLADLRASFQTTGASVAVSGVPQTSGATAINFGAGPVIYVVTAADGTTQSYTVSVTLATPPAKELTAFSFLSSLNPQLTVDVPASIGDTSIVATVPFGTNITALKATFSATGAGVMVSGVPQTSGVTANNFTSPVTYVVTAADSTTKSYMVSVTVAPSSGKDLTSFLFLTANNAGLSADVTATISGTSITATMPFGTDPSALRPSFQTTGASVTVGGAPQTSGASALNFGAGPVTYVVTAADGTTQSYSVSVTVAPALSKELTSFRFLSSLNASVSADVSGTISGTSIAVTVPFGTNVTALRASFTATSSSVTVSGVPQASGVTANNFASPVTYLLIAADSSTKTYTVTVSVAPNSAKDLTSFSFLTANNAGLSADVAGAISGTNITATVPYGTSLSSLQASFQTTGASVTVGGAPQTSGVSALNFGAGAVTYVVTAADGTTQSYSVTVSVAAALSKEFTYFAFLSSRNAQLPADVLGIISGSTISVTLPSGTLRTSLVPSFFATTSNVRVGGVLQTSGVTSNNFTSSVTYLLTAADTSTQSYTVNVSVAQATTLSLSAVTGTVTYGDVSVSVAFPASTSGLGRVDVRRVPGATAPSAACNNGTVVATFATFNDTTATDATGIDAGQFSYRACAYDSSNVLLTGADFDRTVTAARALGIGQTLFVSSANYFGNLGGFTGADAKCQALAQGAGLAGTYMALLSGSTRNASALPLSGAIYTTQGALFAASKADLFDGSFPVSAGFNEYGAAITGAIWSASTVSGGYSGSVNCVDWTTANTGYTGECGLSTSTTGTFFANGTCGCPTTPSRLACIRVSTLPSPTSFTAQTGTVAPGDVVLSLGLPSDTRGYGRVEIRRLAGPTAPTCTTGTIVLSATTFPGSTITLTDSPGQSWGTYSYRACVFDRANNLMTSSQPTATAQGLRAAGTYQTLFASSAQYTPNIGGITQANAACQSLATSAGLGGTYVALVSTGSTLANRVTVSGYVYNTRGMLLATSKADLFDGTLSNPVGYDEYGNAATGSAWTGSTASGGSDANRCSDWTVNACGNASGYASGRAGSVTSVTAALSSTTLDCCQIARLYCLSQ